MSASKNKHGANASLEHVITIDPEAVALLALATRSILQFHRDMGISDYPVTKNLQKVLTRTRAQIREQERPFTKSHFTRPEPRKSARDESVEPVVLETLTDIQEAVIACTACQLSGSRLDSLAKFAGKRPSLMVIGDFSCIGQKQVFDQSEEEMLWNMMRAIGLGPDKVYVTNVIKCRTESESGGDEQCAQRCSSYLFREIATLGPQLICTMGEIPAWQLLGKKAPLTRLRGRFHGSKFIKGNNIMVTYHPRFLLQYPEMKRAAWQDLQLVQRRLQGK